MIRYSQDVKERKILVKSELYQPRVTIFFLIWNDFSLELTDYSDFLHYEDSFYITEKKIVN